MKKFSKIIKIILPLGLGVFLCWYAYNKFTPEQLTQIKEHFKEADYKYVCLSVIFGVLSHISRGLRWQYTLEPMGYFPKKYNSVCAVFIAYLLNLTIPRSGEISRALVLKRYDNVPFDKSFGTIISERIIDMLVLLLFIATAFVLQFELLYDFLLKKIPFERLMWLIFVGGGLFLLAILWLWKSHHPLAYRINKLFSGVKEGVFSIFSLQKKWAFIGHTLFIWAMYFLMFYISFFALEPTQNVSFANILTAFVVGSFAIIFTNGGFGSYPFFIAEILLIFGIAYTLGTTLGWVMWIAQFLMILIFGGLSFLLLPILNKK